MARVWAAKPPAPVAPPPLSPAPQLSPLVRTTGPRSWRNRNPGNVRPVPPPDKWLGQVGVDNAPGGPFSIFRDDAHGFRAVCRVLMRYQARGQTSVRAMLYTYAPPSENKTESYIASVAEALGVKPSEPVDIQDPRVMRELLRAIARVEGGAQCPAWDEAAITEGMRLAGVEG